MFLKLFLWNVPITSLMFDLYSRNIENCYLYLINIWETIL